MGREIKLEGELAESQSYSAQLVEGELHGRRRVKMDHRAIGATPPKCTRHGVAKNGSSKLVCVNAFLPGGVDTPTIRSEGLDH